MPDWSRIFPAGDHRWTMGLRPGDLADDFAPRDPTGETLRERARWLAAEPEKYLALLPAGRASLDDTSALARLLGAPLATNDPADERQRLVALGSALEPDLVWLLPDAAGVHRVVGGIVCFPSSWALTEKLGLPIADVHGPVPELNAVLGRQIDTFLRKLAAGDVWTRENWSLSRSAERNQHTSRPRRALDADVTIAEVYIRLEHQLLLRLPTSGGVLFGIRIEIVPLEELRQDRDAAQRLARLITTMSPEIAHYKNFAPARERLAQLLT
ncbi:MAG: DUF3445 domain-containing protein [Planctomycetaceae bacterium]|nr:DUF3445 domain-containing protein [Planctomycetaceae bacterium]